MVMLLLQRISVTWNIYVNDALVRHRAHALRQQLLQFFQLKMFWNFTCKEIESLNKVLKNSEPVTAVLGGCVIKNHSNRNILDKVDHMIIGGGMTFTFVKALGGKIGNSICEDDKQ
jgi:phosphoglycerate kinase